MSPTDVILSCEDMLSRVVNSTRSPEERCSSNCTKRSQLKSETTLKFSFCLSSFGMSLTLSEETATEEVTAINTVFYGLQRYCTYTYKEAFIPNTHTQIFTRPLNCSALIWIHNQTSVWGLRDTKALVEILCLKFMVFFLVLWELQISTWWHTLNMLNDKCFIMQVLGLGEHE